MTILATSLYRDGTRVCALEGETYKRHLCDRDDFVWVDLSDPTPQDLAVLQPAFALSELAVVEMLSNTRCPLFEDYGDHWFVSIPAPASLSDAAEGGRVAALIGPQYIITVVYGWHRSDARRRRSLDNGSGPTKIGPEYIIYTLLSDAIAAYSDVADAFEEKILAFAYRSLTLSANQEASYSGPRLEAWLYSIAGALEGLSDLQDDIDQCLGARLTGTHSLSFTTLFNRVRNQAQTVRVLVRIMDAAMDYRERKRVHGRTRRWGTLAAGMLVSLIVLVSIHTIARDLVGRSEELVLAMLFFMTRIILVLCTSMLLLALLKGRNRN